MRTQYLAAIAVAALAGMVGSAVYSVRSGDQCPQPSAASVTALFVPCQAYAAATGPTITAEQAMDMGLPSLAPPASAPARQPAPSPATADQQPGSTFLASTLLAGNRAVSAWQTPQER
jgi:enoyl-CoA hydratase/carnithine racemase